MMNKTISIIGCGWLGVPLAKSFIAKGYKVKGSVTKTEKLGGLQQSGIWPFLFELNTNDFTLNDPGLFKTDVVIVAIPPGRTSQVENEFPAKIKQLITILKKYKIKKVLFISSTSVYAENGKTVTENSSIEPVKPSGRALVIAENLLMSNINFDTTVLRFGGLIGPNRNPIRFIQRITQPLNGTACVNFIHLDDCVEIIKEIVRQNCWGEIYNASCPEHPIKREFYTTAAKKSGIPVPIFSTDPVPFKIVDSSKLVKELCFEFKYKSPIECLDDML